MYMIFCVYLNAFVLQAATRLLWASLSFLVRYPFSYVYIDFSWSVHIRHSRLEQIALHYQIPLIHDQFFLLGLYLSRMYSPLSDRLRPIDIVLHGALPWKRMSRGLTLFERHFPAERPTGHRIASCLAIRE